MGHPGRLSERQGIFRQAHRRRLPITAGGSRLLLYDDFNGPAGLLNAHATTPRRPGTAAWSGTGAVFRLTGNGAVGIETAADLAAAVTTPGTLDLRAEASFTGDSYSEQAGSAIGVLLRYASAADHLAAVYETINHMFYLLAFAGGAADMLASSEVGDLLGGPNQITATIDGTAFSARLQTLSGEVVSLGPVTVPGSIPAHNQVGFRLTTVTAECQWFKVFQV